MDSRLNSAEYSTLFSNLKFAQDSSSKKEDSQSASDAAGAHKTVSIESLYDVNPAKDKEVEEDYCMADDEDDNDAEDSSDDNDADDSSDDVSAALDVALAHLLTASAALDAAGFTKSASLSLSLSEFVSEAAAKKKKDKKKGKGKGKSSGKSSKKPNPFAKKKDSDSKSGKSSGSKGSSSSSAGKSSKK